MIAEPNSEPFSAELIDCIKTMDYNQFYSSLHSNRIQFERVGYKYGSSNKLNGMNRVLIDEGLIMDFMLWTPIDRHYKYFTGIKYSDIINYIPEINYLISSMLISLSDDDLQSELATIIKINLINDM